MWKRVKKQLNMNEIYSKRYFGHAQAANKGNITHLQKKLLIKRHFGTKIGHTPF